MQHRLRHWHIVVRPQFWLLAVALVLVAVTLLPSGKPAEQKPLRPRLHAARPVNSALPVLLGTRERIVRDMTLDCSKATCIALTFDDGPSRTTTPQVLSILERQHVPATFFVMGTHVAGNQDLLRRMYSDGDEVGDHSWSHPDFTKLSTSQMHDQISRTQAVIHAAGIPYPTLFRPPYGAVNDNVRTNVDMSFMFWNEDPEDWATRKPDEIVAKVMASAHPGGVLIMHDIYQSTADALPQVIAQLRAKGYQFATPSQMLNIAPGEHGDFYGHPPK